MACLLRGNRNVGIAKSPVPKGVQDLGQRCDGSALCQHHVFVISDETPHKLSRCHLIRDYGCMEHYLVVDIVPVFLRLVFVVVCRVVPTNPSSPVAGGVVLGTWVQRCGVVSLSHLA